MKVNYFLLLSDTVNTAVKSSKIWIYAILFSSVFFNTFFLLGNIISFINGSFIQRLSSEKLIQYQTAWINFFYSMDISSSAAFILFVQLVAILGLFFLILTTLVLFYSWSGLFFSIRSAYANFDSSIYDCSFFAKENWSKIFQISGIYFVGFVVVNSFVFFLLSIFANVFLQAALIIVSLISFIVIGCSSVYSFYLCLFQKLSWKEAINHSFKSLYYNLVDSVFYLLLGGILKSILLALSSFFFIFFIISPSIQIINSLTQNLTSNPQFDLITVALASIIIYLLFQLSAILTSLSLYFSTAFNLIFNEDIYEKTEKEVDK